MLMLMLAVLSALARVKLPLHMVWPRDVRDPARDVALEILLSIADLVAASA